MDSVIAHLGLLIHLPLPRIVVAHTERQVDPSLDYERDNFVT
jgi:hypothetical protein